MTSVCAPENPASLQNDSVLLTKSSLEALRESVVWSVISSAAASALLYKELGNECKAREEDAAIVCRYTGTTGANIQVELQQAGIHGKDGCVAADIVHWPGFRGRGEQVDTARVGLRVPRNPRRPYPEEPGVGLRTLEPG
jgi:hypothetical protein